jgi:hypothetical protein
MARFSYRSVLWGPPQVAAASSPDRAPAWLTSRGQGRRRSTCARSARWGPVPDPAAADKYVSRWRMGAVVRHRPAVNRSAEWGAPLNQPRAPRWLFGALSFHRVARAPNSTDWGPPLDPAAADKYLPRIRTGAPVRHRAARNQSTEWAAPLNQPKAPRWLSSTIAVHRADHAPSRSTRWSPPADPAAADTCIPRWRFGAFARHRLAMLHSTDWGPPSAPASIIPDRGPAWLIARLRHRTVLARSADWGPPPDATIAPVPAPRWSLLGRARHRSAASRSTDWAPPLGVTDRAPSWILPRLLRHSARVQSRAWGVPLDTSVPTVHLPAWCRALTANHRRTAGRAVQWTAPLGSSVTAQTLIGASISNATVTRLLDGTVTFATIGGSVVVLE